jgi:hypothetical protein
MLKYIKAHIRVSELHTQEVTVPEWEVPILRAIHAANGDAVTVVGEELIDRTPPFAGDEFVRLATRYRNTKTDDGGQGIPYVASVYGQFGVGNDRLEQAIKAATVADAEIVETPAEDLIGEKVSSVGG